MYYICNGLKRKQYEKYGFPMTMTETEMAKELGVSFATVNRWENGHH